LNANKPAVKMPTPRHYLCHRVARPITIDGSLRDPAWMNLPWTEVFVDITGNETLRPRFRTRAKMGWNGEFLFVGAEMEEPHVWGTITKRNSVIFEDNDFEVFIDPEEQEHPEDNWVWSPQGKVNMHLPLRWGEVEFG